MILSFDLLAIVTGGDLLACVYNGPPETAIEQRPKIQRVNLDLDTWLGVVVIDMVGGQGQVGGSDSAGGREIIRVVERRHTDIVIKDDGSVLGL